MITVIPILLSEKLKVILDYFSQKYKVIIFIEKIDPNRSEL